MEARFQQFPFNKHVKDVGRTCSSSKKWEGQVNSELENHSMLCLMLSCDREKSSGFPCVLAATICPINCIYIINSPKCSVRKINMKINGMLLGNIFALYVLKQSETFVIGIKKDDTFLNH